MCFEERKIPAAIVGVFSIILFIISLVMIALSVKFNNSGLSTDLGSMGDYTNVAFIVLLTASIVALMSAICGCLSCKIKNRIVTVCFGLTLLPAAVAIIVFGAILTGISNTPESEIREFCVSNQEEFDDTKTSDKFLAELRGTIEEVDYKIGDLISSAMCSNLCPCDRTGESPEVQAKWTAVFADQTLLTKYDRCIPATPGCDIERAIVFFQGDELEIMKQFGMSAYGTFK